MEQGWGSDVGVCCREAFVEAGKVPMASAEELLGSRSGPAGAWAEWSLVNVFAGWPGEVGKQAGVKAAVEVEVEVEVEDARCHAARLKQRRWGRLLASCSSAASAPTPCRCMSRTPTQA